MKRVILIILSLICSTNLLAKQEVIDSLERILSSEIHDTIKAKVLRQLGWKYADVDLDKCINTSNRLMEVGKRLKDNRIIAIAYNLLGVANDYNNADINVVLDFYNKSLAYTDKIDEPKLKANVLNNMGLTYVRAGQYLKSYAAHEEALTIVEELKDTITMVRCYNNIAVGFTEREDPQKAKVYYKIALDYSKSLGNKAYIAALTNNIGNIYHEEGVLDTALMMFEEALALKRGLGQKRPLITTLTNIADIYNGQEEYAKSIDLAKEAYAIAKELNYPHGQALALYCLSEIYESQGNFDQSIRVANSALNILGESGKLHLRKELNLHLSQIYEVIENNTLAFRHFKAYSLMKDSLYEEEKMRQIDQLELKHQIQAKEIENKLLRTEQEMIEETLKNRTSLGIGLCITLFLVAGWGFAVYRSNREKKRLNLLLESEVQHRTQELEEVNSDLKQANYELRAFNHIASHDIKEPIRNIGNYSSLVFRKLPDELQENFREEFHFIKSNANQLYTLIEDFARYTSMSNQEAVRIEKVDLNDLVTSLNIVIGTGKGTILNHGLPVLPTNSALMYIAFKNLIENGLKFNQSEEPKVELSYEEKERAYHLIIEDNGIGIPKSYHQNIFTMFKRLHNRAEYEGSGIGLALVKLVMDKLGGQIELDSSPEKGSRFTLVLPK